MADTKPETYEHRRYGFGRTIDRYDQPDSPQLESVQRWLLRYSVELLHGPWEVDYGKEELVVVCLLRNGRPYIRSFVEHYLSLGAKHLFFLDNGSTDGTVEALREYDEVTVLYTEMPFKRYQLLMRQYLVERFGRERWSLLVDIDELFDYPYSDVIGLRDFLRYLNEGGYTAAVAYMLDMFPETLTESSENGGMDLKERHRFYDISDIRSYSYHTAEQTGNVLANEEIKILQDGVQKRLFKLYPMLIKHPLVFMEEGVRPADMSEHWAGGVRVADLTGVLYHYKLADLHSLVRREVSERRYISRWNKYDKYLKVLEKNPEMKVKNKDSRELESVNDLVANGFLTVSPNYMELVQDRKPSRLVEAFFRGRREMEHQKRTVKRLKNARNKERREAEELRRQLQGMLASKSWRTLDGLNRLRKAISKRTASLSKRRATGE